MMCMANEGDVEAIALREQQLPRRTKQQALIQQQQQERLEKQKNRRGTRSV